MIRLSPELYFRGVSKQKFVLSALVIVFVSTFAALSICLTNKVGAASLTGASVTLSNSRLSFKALILTGSSGSSLVTIQGGGGDVNTNHLFPGDVLCFTDAGNNGCIDNTTYTVANIISTTQFNITAPLTTALTATDYAVASRSGTWTLAFTTTNTVPIGGKLVITIPMADNALGNDGIPDTASSIATSGFDLNKMGTGDISVSTVADCVGADWGSVTITPGSGTTDHVLSWTRATSTCAGSKAITVTIAGPGIVNPAPITSGHTQGTSDVYGISIKTTDGTNIIDSAIPRAAPVEAVLISANVDESLSLVVIGLSAGTYCGASQTIATTATSIPWGTLTAANTFYYAAQRLTVNTNAAGGYAVTLQESDQMGKNGNVCTGVTPSSGHYTFSSATCIRDTVCSAVGCDHNTAQDWTDPTNFPGLGYSLASVSGTDAPFYYNEKNRTYSAKDMADNQGGETSSAVPTIMGNSGPVSNSQIYVCYTITIPGTQPSGYYYNIAKYTATATF